MQTKPEVQWLDPHRTVDQPELARLSGMSVADLDQLLNYGALLPTEGRVARVFNAGNLAPLRKAARLRADFDLDLVTTSLLLGYLQRIAQLENQLRGLQAHPSPPQTLPREGPTPWYEPHA